MLLALTLCFCAAALVAHLLPDTALGRTCRAWAIERPAAWFSKLSAAKVLAAVLFVAALASVAPVLPIEAAFLAAGDLAIYFEVLAGVALLAVRSRGVRPTCRDLLWSVVSPGRRLIGRLRARSRRPRSRPRKRLSPAGPNDVEPWASLPVFA